MKTAAIFLVTLIIVSGKLLGGTVSGLIPDSLILKKFNLSLETKKHDKEEDKIIINLKVNVLNGIRDVYLLVENKNTEIKPVINDGVATIQFEVDKKMLDKTYLHLSYNIGQNGAELGCTDNYYMFLKDFIK